MSLALFARSLSASLLMSCAMIDPALAEIRENIVKIPVRVAGPDGALYTQTSH
jgi:hypothetical protein